MTINLLRHTIEHMATPELEPLSNISNIFELQARESDRTEKALRAARLATRLVARGNVEIEGIPLTELIARDLGYTSWDRIGAIREVEELLSDADSAIEVAITEAHMNGAQAREMMIRSPESDEPPADQLH